MDGRAPRRRGRLVGSAGIALALLAAITPIEPAWDRMLLVSLPMVSNRDYVAHDLVPA